MKIVLSIEGFRFAVISETGNRYRSFIVNTNIVFHNWREIFYYKFESNFDNYKFYRILNFGIVLKDIDKQ